MQTVEEDRRIRDHRLVVVSRPAELGPWPGVVMLHEIFGIDEVLRRHAQRLAAAGFVVYAPDLFDDGPRLGCMISMFRSLRAEAGRPFEVIDAARREVAADPACTGRVGVIGFCAGGGFALLSASRGFAAASVNYGPIADDLPRSLRGACPVVASYGGRDALARQVPRLQEALDAEGVTNDVVVYPDAGHAFLNDADVGPRALRPLMRLAHVGPEPTSAAAAWPRIEAFLAQHLGS